MDGSSDSGAWTDQVSEFEAAMDAEGLRCDEGIQADGRLHRYKAPGDSDKDGFYVVHLDGIAAGMFGHWAKHPEPIKWRAKGSQPLDREQSAKLKRAIDEARAQREAEKAEAQAAVAKRSNEEWIGLKNADADHPYLVRKRVGTHGIKETKDGRLAVAVFVDEKITSMQYISDDGAKLFQKSGAVAGGYYRLGGKPNEVAYICEGFATAASVREATNATVYTAFSGHNLPLVAQWLHKKYPDLKIIIVADNDCETDDNPGLKYARQAAGLADGTYIIPKLTAAPDKRCDINDLHIAEGLEAVRNLLQPGFGVLFSTIEEEPCHYIFDGYLALGSIHELIGDPETVKTTVVLDWCARITTGRGFPDSENALIPPSFVMILSGEDTARSTLKPRLRVAGADMEKVREIPRVFESPDDDGVLTPLVIPDHLPMIEQQIRVDGTKLFVVDPLEVFFPDRTNSHNNASTRKVLAELSAMAERTGCAILSIRHLNKMGSVERALYRGGGSIAFAAASRISMAMGLDPTEHGMRNDDPQRRHVLAIVKNNLGPHEPSRACRKAVPENTIDEAHPKGIVCVEWVAGTVPVTADDLMRQQHKQRNPEALEEAVEFLRDELREADKPVKEVEEKARALGISKKTLERARKKARVRSRPKGFTGPHLLYLVRKDDGKDAPDESDDV
jgi:putative DNA primase/helicase